MSELIEFISLQGKLLDFMDKYGLVGLMYTNEGQLKEYIKEEFGLENPKEIEDRRRDLRRREDEKSHARQRQLFG